MCRSDKDSEPEVNSEERIKRNLGGLFVWFNCLVELNMQERDIVSQYKTYKGFQQT